MSDNLNLNTRKPINLGIYLIITIVLSSLMLIIMGVYEFYNAVQSVNWPITEGKILETSLISSSSKSSYRSILVSYSYTINGVVYHNDRISYSQIYKKRYSDPSFASSFYKTNTGIKVYYDPSSPNKSVLKSGYMREVNEFSTIITGSFMFTISMAFCILSRHRAKNDVV